VDSRRQSVLEVHKHFGPVETAGFDDATDEFGAVLKIVIFLAGVKALEIVALFLKAGHFHLNLAETAAELLVGFTQGEKLQTKVDEQKAAKGGDDGRANEKAAVADQRFSSKI